MTNALTLIRTLDTPTESRPKREKPISQRDRTKEARAAKGSTQVK